MRNTKREEGGRRERDPKRCKKDCPHEFGFLGFWFQYCVSAIFSLPFAPRLPEKKMGCGERMKPGPSKELRQTPPAEHARNQRAATWRGVCYNERSESQTP
jgi:hypothetical protein